MGTHSLWFNLVINPHSLNNEFISTISESEIFDLIVYLIYNGIAINNSINALHGNTNVEDIQKRNIETKKLYIIKFLLFKLLSFFRWNLPKIHNNLPTVHQEFSFTEFKKFCEQENVPENWKIFSDILYHRWIIYFEQKSTYPDKNNFKIYNNNVNQTMLDPYFVSNDIQENLTKKVQTNCYYSVNEIEKYIKQLENGNIINQIYMPTFDCFGIDLKDNSDRIQFNFFSDKGIFIERNSFLDDLYNELAIWNYIHGDYSKAHYYFSRIKMKLNFSYLDDYIHITYCMISKNYKFESKSTNDEDKLLKFITSILKEDSEWFNIFDYQKSIDDKKIINNLKHICDKNPDKMYLFKRISKYLIFKLKNLYEVLDPNLKSFFLDIEKGAEQEKNDNEVIEEGEINDEEISLDEDTEFMMLQATDPDLILNLIPSIKRPPSSINSKWLVPKYDEILYHGSLAPSDLQKCYLILAKANELRNAKYFKESRVLYLSLLEDIQASHPLLAEMIRYELLQTDIERFFFQKEKGSSLQDDLESKCINFLKDINKQNYNHFKELIELVCLFSLEYGYGLQEFINHQIEIVRFSACLSHLTIHSNQRDNKGKEFWEFCLGSFILPNSKYANNFPKISFSVSFGDFIGKFKRNITAANLISTCLIKIYSTIKEHPSQQIVPTGFKYDLFPSSMSANMIVSVDCPLVTITIDQVLRSYINNFPQETHLMRFYAEFMLNENQYAQAMKYFIEIIIYNTDNFIHFDYLESNESIIHQMIFCANKLGHHILAGILYQFSANPDYGHAFKELSQNNYIDSSDDLYDCIWDVALLEYLIHFHTRRGEDERKWKAIKLISQLDINSNNNPVNLKEAANLRKSRLFQMLARQYL